MSSIEWDSGMNAPVRLASADCEEVNLGGSTVWTIATVNATPPLLPRIPVAWCPFPSLQQHGYLHWRITGEWSQDAVAAGINVRPISSLNVAAYLDRAPGPFTGSLAPEMVFSTGAAAIAAGSRFVLDVRMDVIGDTSGRNEQIWTGKLVVVRGDAGASAGTIMANVEAASISNLDQTADQDVSLYIYKTGAGAPVGKVMTCVCTHVGQRNGS